MVIALALGSVVGAVAFVPSPASADCSGPTIWYMPRSVVRGEVVSVRGTGWGDACYDTGHFADVLYECRLIVMKIVFTASANAPSPGDKRRRNNFFH